MIEFIRAGVLPEGVRSDIGDIYEYMLEVEKSGAEAYAAISEGYISVMIDDGGERLFSYPVSISDGKDESALIDGILELCRELGIKPCFIDTPRGALPKLLCGVKHADIDGDGEYYTVNIKNECMLLEYPPELMCEEIYLSEPAEKHAEDYKRLILDKEHNIFWGNDLRSELSDVDARFFIDEAREEFNTGAAITLHATVLSDNGENIFVGEGVLYRFDFKGGCEIAVRVLPEYCGRGYGRMIVDGILEIARGLGLSLVVCNIDKRNTAALRCFTKEFFEDMGDADGGIAHLEAHL